MATQICQGCYGLTIDNTMLKVVGNVLTVQGVTTPSRIISACGLLLDSDVFEVLTQNNGRNPVITSVNVPSTTYPSQYRMLGDCNGIYFDSRFFSLTSVGALTFTEGFVLTINATPSTATISVTENGSAVQPIAGTTNQFLMTEIDATYTYTVSATNYTTQTSTVTANDNQTVTITLVKDTIYTTFSINNEEHPTVTIEVKEGDTVIPSTENARIYSCRANTEYTYTVTDTTNNTTATGSFTTAYEDDTITPTNFA